MPFSEPESDYTLTLMEQAVAAELAYYRQVDLCSPTVGDWTSWQHQKANYEAANPTNEFPGAYDSSLYARHMLERHGYSLHHYMAYHLSPEAWKEWFEQVDFVSLLFVVKA